MEPPVELVCGVYGAGNVFPVKVARDARVGALQEAIADAMRYKALYGYIPHELRLYLARKNGEWLKSGRTAEQLLMGGNIDANFEVLRYSWRLNREGLLGGDFVPTINDIHILVELPPPLLPLIQKDDGTWKTKVQWKQPKRLCSTSGKDWPYQGEAVLVDKLIDPLTRQYNAWTRDYHDHPVLLVMGGQGTGKSRMLEQMDTLLCKASEQVKEPALLPRMAAAIKFHIAFDGDTPPKWPGLLDPMYPELDISARMLYQIWKEEISWFDFWVQVKHEWFPLTIDRVIDVLALQLERKPSELTVILCIDGLDKLPHDETKTCDLYRVVAAIRNFLNRSKAFTVCVCSSTIQLPVSSALNDGSQYRVFLQPPTLDGDAILHPKTALEKQLVEDMGGHGRALEVLQALIVSDVGLNQFNNKKPADVVQIVLTGLRISYSGLFQSPLTQKYRLELLAAVLSRHRCGLDEVIGQSGVTVDELRSFGLIRWTSEFHIECAPILVLSLLQDDEFTSAMFNQQSFEHFLAWFRRMKSIVYRNTQVPLSTLHAGAKFSPFSSMGSTRVVEPHERKVVQSVAHVDTKEMENDHAIVTKPQESVMLGTTDTVVVNGESGVVIARIQMMAPDKSTTGCNEVMKCKFIPNDQHLNAQRYRREREKAVVDSTDLFLLITNVEDTRFPLRPQCGLVSRDNFVDYFGVFAPRVYRSLNNKTASLSRLDAAKAGGSEAKSEDPFASDQEAFKPVKKRRTTPKKTKKL